MMAVESILGVELRLDASSYTYLAEGRTHVVFSCHDSPLVLRVYKACAPPGESSDSRPVKIENERASARFSHLIWSSVLNQNAISLERVVYLPLSFVQGLNAILMSCPDRPAHRTKPLQGIGCKSHAQIPGTVMRNALSLDHIQSSKEAISDTSDVENVVWGVEFKPKCGFLTSSPFVPKNSLKRRVSRYHMHQHLKLAQGKVRRVSEYSPLDFFSGDKESQARALRGLIACPQNNLRVFANGVKVFPHKEYADLTPSEYEQSLDEALRAYGWNPHDKSCDLIASFVNAVVSILVKEASLLSRVLSAQRLDEIDIVGAKQILNELVVSQRSSQEINFEDACSVQTMLQACETCPAMFNTKDFVLSTSKRRECNSAQNILLLRRFLLGRTAMDCSLIFAFTLADFLTEETETVSFVAKHSATVVDLGLKKLAKLDKWVKLDSVIVNHYASVSPFNSVHGDNRC